MYEKYVQLALIPIKRFSVHWEGKITAALGCRSKQPDNYNNNNSCDEIL